MERFEIRRVWWLCEPPGVGAGRKAFQAVADGGIESRFLQTGERFQLGGEVMVEVLNASGETGALRLTWQNFRALIPARVAPGDLGEAVEGTGLLVLARSGLEENTLPQWTESGAQVVVSAPETPTTTLPGEWVRLNLWGWVKVSTDGVKMWVEQGNP